MGADVHFDNEIATRNSPGSRKQRKFGENSGKKLYARSSVPVSPSPRLL